MPESFSVNPIEVLSEPDRGSSSIQIIQDALDETGLDKAPRVRMARLLSDNGSGLVGKDFQSVHLLKPIPSGADQRQDRTIPQVAGGTRAARNARLSVGVGRRDQGFCGLLQCRTLS